MASLASITLGGKPVYEAPSCYRPRFGPGRPINYLRMSTGANCGVGRFLMLRSDYDTLRDNSDSGTVELVMGSGLDDPASGLTVTVVLAAADPAITSTTDDSSDLVEVTVLDRRVLNVGPVSDSFNVQQAGFPTTGSDTAKYYSETLNSSTAYTWAGICAKLELPAPGSGIFPSWTPRNLVYDGVPLFRVADDLSSRAFVVIGYDHQANTITWNSPGVSGSNDLLNAMNAYLLAGGDGELNPLRIPGHLKVWFQGSSNNSDPFTQRSYVKSVSTGGNSNPNLTQTLHCGGQIAVYSGGAWANQSDLDTIAADLTQRWVTFANQARGISRYAGIWPLQPDGYIRQIEWRSGPDGAFTTIRYGNYIDWNVMGSPGDIMETISNTLIMPLGGGMADVSPGGARYVLTGSTADVWVKITGSGSIGDASGVYTAARILTGSATDTVAPPDGFTDPGADNAIIFNVPESTLAGNVHWLKTDGTWQGPGQRIGTDTATGKAIVAIEAPNPYGMFAVTVVHDGGSAGDNTTPAAATYTYTVTDLNGVQLGTTVAVVSARQKGHVTAATNGTAFFNSSGAVKLMTVDEVIDAGVCS